MIRAASSSSQEVQPNNLRLFTPSSLLRHEQWEANVFTNIYSQNEVDSSGIDVGLDQRQTFLNTIIQFTYGSSKSSRMNIGIDFWVNAARYDRNRNSSLFRILRFEDFAQLTSSDTIITPERTEIIDGQVTFVPADTTITPIGVEEFGRVALGAIGPRVKVAPFIWLPKFSIQSTLLFPIASDLETPAFVGHDRISWWNQFFYDMTYDKFQVFLEADLLYRFESRNEDQDRESRRGFLRVPLTGFFNYFVTEDFTTFFFVQHSQVHKRLPPNSDTRFARVRHFTQLGLGIKYQVTRSLGLETSYTRFVDSRNDGLGETVNLGIRYIRR